MNALIPESIAVLSAQEKEDSFNARFDCKKKEYNREMGFYEIDFEIPINIEPVAGYVTPMGSALTLAESIVREWVNRTDKSRNNRNIR